MMGHGLWIGFFLFITSKDQVGATSLCDTDLIDKIKAFWASEGIEGGPKNAFSTYKRIGPENTYWTTGYLFEAQDDIRCDYPVFTDDGLVYVHQFHNSSLEVGFVPYYEESDHYRNLVTGDRLYYIRVNDCGVSAWHRCNDNAEAGDPAGAVKVARGFSPEAVTRALKVMDDLGFKMVHQYSLNCNPRYPNCQDE